MKINKTRISSLKNNLPDSLFGKKIIPAIILDAKKDRIDILNLGFSEKMEVGESILPAKSGTVSMFNAEGKDVIDRTKPKETRYQEFEWTREEWAGRGKTETVTNSVIRPYKRWSRIFVPPLSVQFTISKIEGSKLTITAPCIEWSDENGNILIHEINLFLEKFKTCDVLDEKQVPVIKVTKSLNWTILPPGKRPWEEQRKFLKPVLDLVKSKNKKPVLDSRLENINTLQPEFTAIGNQGFGGYIVFGFPKKDIYVLESAFYGNAIYVFSENWEDLSKRTKAEILNAKLQIERITHHGERVDWLKRLSELLK